MLKISTEFIYEVENIIKLNLLNYRQMIWYIIPKDECHPDNEYELLLKDRNEINIYEEYNYFYLNSKDYERMERTEYYDLEQEYLINNFPDYNVDDEDADLPNITMQEKSLLWYKANIITKNKIAKKIVKIIRNLYKTKGNIKIYVGRTKMFEAENETDEDITFNENITDRLEFDILSAKYNNFYRQDCTLAYKTISERGKKRNHLYQLSRLGELYDQYPNWSENYIMNNQ